MTSREGRAGRVWGGGALIKIFPTVNNLSPVINIWTLIHALSASCGQRAPTQRRPESCGRHKSDVPRIYIFGILKHKATCKPLAQTLSPFSEKDDTFFPSEPKLWIFKGFSSYQVIHHGTAGHLATDSLLRQRTYTTAAAATQALIYVPGGDPSIISSITAAGRDT